MRTAKFQYKCRQCGKIEEDPYTSEANAQMTLLSIIHGHDISHLKLIGMTPKMTAVHFCSSDGDHGVADLIGYKVYDQNNKTPDTPGT